MGTFKKKITVSLDKETLERLDEIAKECYRSVDRTKAIRWMIDDAFKEMKTGINLFRDKQIIEEEV